MKDNRQTLYLISNMYPSKANIRYGVFVKNFKNAVNKKYKIKKIVLAKKYGKLTKLAGYLQLYFKIFRLYFKASSHDLIYVHAPLFMAPVLSLFCWSNKKVFLNFHGNDLLFNSFKKKILSQFQKCLIKKYPVVVPSAHYEQKVMQLYKKNPDDILIYPSGGIDTKIFHPNPLLKSSDFTISYVSSFIPEKGWNVFLNAVKILFDRKDIPGLKILMVGDGPDKTKIKNLIKAHSLPVQLHSGLTHSQIAKIYQQSDIFIFPTRYKGESLGLVGLEAMACGVPVIGSKHPALQTYLIEGENGFLFDTNNTEDLYKTILRFYNLPQHKKEKMTKNAFETALRYENQKVNKELLNFLTDKNPRV